MKFAAAIFAALLLASCSQQVDQKRAPSSTWTREQAVGAVGLFGLHAVTIEATGSMLPAYDEKTIIGAEAVTDSTQLHAGDVLIYQMADGRFCIHRAIQIDGATVLMRGDNNAQADGWVNRSAIKWREVMAIRTEGSK